MKKVYKVISFIVTVLLALILCLNLYMIIRKKVAKDNYPTVGGYGLGVIISGSMTGTINVDDMVLTKRQKEYYVGDIIMFHEEQLLITHRIVGKTDEGFITKGDANNVEDSTVVVPSAICGKIVKIIPKAGKVVALLRSPIGLCMIAIIGFALIVLPGYIQKEKPSETKKQAEKIAADELQKLTEEQEECESQE